MLFLKVWKLLHVLGRLLSRENLEVLWRLLLLKLRRLQVPKSIQVTIFCILFDCLFNILSLINTYFILDQYIWHPTDFSFYFNLLLCSEVFNWILDKSYTFYFWLSTSLRCTISDILNIIIVALELKSNHFGEEFLVFNKNILNY